MTGFPMSESGVPDPEDVQILRASFASFASVAADLSGTETAMSPDAGPTGSSGSPKPRSWRAIPSTDVEIAPTAPGFHAGALLGLRVHPCTIKSVGRALAEQPELPFTGPDNCSEDSDRVRSRGRQGRWPPGCVTADSRYPTPLHALVRFGTRAAGAVIVRSTSTG
jgi:hypothetical protein